MFRKVSILLLLATGANAQKRVANIPFCAAPQGSVWGPLLEEIARNGPLGPFNNAVTPAGPLPAAGTISTATGLLAGTYVGNLFNGACPNPAVAPPAAGAGIGHWESTCTNDILHPVVLNVAAPAGGIASAAAFQTFCSAAAQVALVAPLNPAANNVRCRGEVAVTANAPKNKFPGSTAFFDYVPTVAYTAVGGFPLTPAAAFPVAVAAGSNVFCVYAPSFTATAAPAGGTGKWTKSYINSITLAATPVVPAVAGSYLPGGPGGAGFTNAQLLAGPLARPQYNVGTTVNYFKNYLNWNQL